MGIKPNIIISTYYLIDAALWSHSDLCIFPTGRLAWAGLFKNGVPHGASWRGVEGGGDFGTLQEVGEAGGSVVLRAGTRYAVTESNGAGCQEVGHAG